MFFLQVYLCRYIFLIPVQYLEPPSFSVSWKTSSGSTLIRLGFLQDSWSYYRQFWSCKALLQSKTIAKLFVLVGHSDFKLFQCSRRLQCWNMELKQRPVYFRLAPRALKTLPEPPFKSLFKQNNMLPTWSQKTKMHRVFHIFTHDRCTGSDLLNANLQLWVSWQLDRNWQMTPLRLFYSTCGIKGWIAL